MSNGIDWDNLGFDLTHVAPMMYMATTSGGEGAVWEGGLRPYGKLEMFPAAQALMYGQSIYEGLKAHRSAKGRIVLFRPEENAARMAAGARRMVMPPFPEDKFVEAVKEVVLANADWVPPLGKGSMYIRPLLMGTGPMLGLNPAPSYTFVIFVTAVGSYFKGGQLSPTNLAIEQQFHRSAPLGGMGGTKAAGNYSPTLFPLAQARAQGFTDLLYLDAATSTYLEEGSACNIFAIKGKHVKTPPLNGTILPGVTRKSLLQLARERGFTVEESPVSAAEAMQADELFTSGTAQVISPVGTLTFKGEKRQFGVPGEPSPLAMQLYTALTDIQTERANDPYGWVVPLVEK